MLNRIHAIILTLLLVLPLSAEPADTFAIAIRGRIDNILRDDILERTQLGLYVYDITADTPLYDHGSRQCLRPASCMKIVTATAALARLGSDYNYRTQLFCTDSATVAIRGGMDPMIGPDDLRAFAHRLLADSISSINGPIILDRSVKDSTALGWGWCWDDPDVPLCALLYRGKATFEERLSHALADAGISFGGQYVYNTIPPDARLLVTRTHTISQILQPMMKNSDNLYAETLFYQLAALSHKPYAGRKDAARQIDSLITVTGHNPEHYQIADGSGLSLYNYVTAQLLVDLLRYAHANPEIHATLYPALPVMGRDGTLRKRCKGTAAQDRVHAKTGTVTGVSSLAGYATSPNGHLLAFAIINQGLRSTSTGRNFQDRICIALTQPLDIPTIEPDALSTPAEDECSDEEDE